MNTTRGLILIACALPLLAGAPARRSTKAKSTPAPAARAVTPAPSPGPLLAPLPDRTTIVPFPVPGDSSGEVSARMRVQNVPREGLTTIAPVPRPGGAGGPLGSPRIDVLPEPTFSPAPEYPHAARDAGIQGTVVVMAYVLSDGRVGEVRVVRSVPGLDDAAMAAVRRYRFRPALRDGRPVPVGVAVPVRFTLH